MATTPRTSTTRQREVDYPTSDGKPMAETDLHRKDMVDVIMALETHFAANPNVYVSGNILVFYEEGNRRKHVSPDALVAFGVPKEPLREYYLVWKEGKAPDVVIEITSRTTRREDQGKKRVLYRDVLKVPEYFQFDPTEDYLKPSLQGHRLEAGEYVPIEPVEGRLPSAVLGLHLQRVGMELRLYDPVTGLFVPKQVEKTEEERRAKEEAVQREQEAVQREQEAVQREQEAVQREQEAVQRGQEAILQAEEERRAREEADRARLDEHAARLRSEAETERLRRELDELKRRSMDQAGGAQPPPEPES